MPSVVHASVRSVGPAERVVTGASTNAGHHRWQHTSVAQPVVVSVVIGSEVIGSSPPPVGIMTVSMMCTVALDVGMSAQTTLA